MGIVQKMMAEIFKDYYEHEYALYLRKYIIEECLLTWMEK
jgi:hypothetical protein